MINNLDDILQKLKMTEISPPGPNQSSQKCYVYSLRAMYFYLREQKVVHFFLSS